MDKRYVFFTFKAHVAEVELFEDFFAIMKPFIKSHPEYAYCIEKDGTLDRHLHLLVHSPKYTEMKQFKQKLNANKFKDYRHYIKDAYQTHESYAYNTKLVEPEQESLMKVLGYIYKDEECTRRESLSFSQEYILDSFKLYYTSEKIKYKMRKGDWKYINNKNSHAMIEDFIEKSEEYNYKSLDSNKWYEIKWKMIKQGVSFQQLKDEVIAITLSELLIRHVQTEYKPGDQFNGGEPKLCCDECGEWYANLSFEDAVKFYGSPYPAMCQCQKEKFWKSPIK